MEQGRQKLGGELSDALLNAQQRQGQQIGLFSCGRAAWFQACRSLVKASDDKNTPHGPAYPAGFTGYITLGLWGDV